MRLPNMKKYLFISIILRLYISWFSKIIKVEYIQVTTFNDEKNTDFELKKRPILTKITRMGHI